MKPENVENYIKSFPEESQKLLKTVRETVKKAAPEAMEVISYSMPAYKLNGILVWFAAHTNHIGFYPGASGIAAFKKELANYKSAKGSVQFPFNQPLPLDLITRIVKFRVNENLLKANARKQKLK